MIRIISFDNQTSLTFNHDKTKKLPTQLFLDYLSPFLDVSSSFSLKHVSKPFGNLYSQMRCLRVITNYLNVSDTCALSMTCRQWKKLSSTLWQEQPRKQLLCLMQIAHAQLGKKIVECWRENHSHLSHEALRAEVHRKMYPEQSEGMQMLMQDLTSPSPDRQSDVTGVIDVLSAPVFFPAHRQSFKENEIAEWNMYINSWFLNDSHILHDFAPPSFLLPSRCKNLVKRSKEKYFEKMAALIRQMSGSPQCREIIWETLIKRCHVTGLHHLVPPLFKEFEEPSARINVQIAHYLHTQNFNLALTHAMQMRIMEKEEQRKQNRWTTPCLGRNPSRDIEQIVVNLGKQGKEGKALSLLLNNDLFREAAIRAVSRVSCFEDLEICRDILNDKFPLQVLVQLMILSCHHQGIDKTIQLVACIPYQRIRNFIINHLILRLAQPARYVEIWEYHIEELLIPKRAMSDEELMERCDQIKTYFTAASIGQPSSLSSTPEQTVLESLKSTAFIRDVEKAIELFDKYPTNEDSDIKLSLIWRSIYIIDALLELGDQARAKKFLPYLQLEKICFGFRICISMNSGSLNDYPRVIKFIEEDK